MRIAITGSSGFIGSELSRLTLVRGHQVVLMQRNPPAFLPPGAHYLPFDLRSPSLPNPVGLTAVVHCAVMFHNRTNPDAEQVNIRATLALRDHCRAHGIHFVFLSTMSAHAEAESVYGRHKYQLEQMMDAPNETVLKLGLVIGRSGGLFQRIQSTIERFPIIPLIDGGRQPIQTVGIDEVCLIVAKSIEERFVGHYAIGSIDVIHLRALYERISLQIGRNPIYLPVPLFAFSALLKVLSILPFAIPVSDENLKGLKHLRSFHTCADLNRLGVSLRPLMDILHEAK